MADARKDKRTLLSLKIRYKSATLEDFIERYSMDISRGGVFIKAKKPLAVGTLLKFEFMLQDQSTLIHGVGRVVWRREESEADAENPAGMGIKFIKMDPDSRSVVQRIVEDRVDPGVFEHGKHGAPSDSAELGGDSTKVRHVSEFLASAFEQGGASEAATREANVQRARASSARPMARGAFSASGDVGGRRGSPSDAPARGAVSAFGGVSLGASSRFHSSAAPAMDELDADDDFLDDETTKVQELPASSDFPDAAATVIASESPLVAERRQTPVVPASSSPLQDAVPDLFGPDSFGPAPGELIDASLLDPAVATVPPKASALPRGAVPDSAAIPSEALRVPQAPAPVAVEVPAETPKRSRGWMLLLLMLLLIASAGVAAWKLGLADDFMELAAPYLGQSSDAATPRPANPTLAASPAGPGVPKDTEATAQEPATDEATAEAKEAESPGAVEPATPAAADGLVRIRVVSVPPGAWVSVDGKGVGRAPVTLEHEPGTRLSVYSKARGFLPTRQQVVVTASEPELKLVLSPLPYVVSVVTEPEGATASAVGGGETVTPGELVFRTMPSSRKIVVSKDGYTTTTTLVSRSSFIEEKTRMVASVRVRLAKAAAKASAAPAAAPAPEPATSSASAEAPAEAPAAPPDLDAAPAAPKPPEAAASDEPAVDAP